MGQWKDRIVLSFTHSFSLWNATPTSPTIFCTYQFSKKSYFWECSQDLFRVRAWVNLQKSFGHSPNPFFFYFCSRFHVMKFLGGDLSLCCQKITKKIIFHKFFFPCNLEDLGSPILKQSDLLLSTYFLIFILFIYSFNTTGLIAPAGIELI